MGDDAVINFRTGTWLRDAVAGPAMSRGTMEKQ